MNKATCVFIAIGVFIFLTGCQPTGRPEAKQAQPVHNKHYVSIDGLWRVTPETALKFPNGTLEPVIRISGEAYGDLKVQGCFLWDKRFYDDWPIKSVTYTDSTRQLEIVYNEGAVYRGVVGKDRKTITGVAYSDAWGDTTNRVHENKLDFVRDEQTDENRLFFPRPADVHGSMVYQYHQPEQLDRYLQTASLLDYVKDTTAFYRLMERIIKQKFGRLESILVLKDRKLVLEEYFYGYNRTHLHPIHSCTKSVTSLLLGIALNRHNKMDVDQPVFSFFPQYDSLKTPEKEKITLKHVLTMTPGFTDEDDFDAHSPDEEAQKILSLPMVSAPGEKFKYNGNCTNLMGDIIYSLENKQADELAQEVLFNKLGISNFEWERENGVVRCASDLRMLPGDMAKIGLLVLNNGNWNGEQIVPKEWIAESTQPHVAESPFFDYGYQWWCRSKSNRSWWKHPVHGSRDEHDMFLALGYGGQYIMVIRDLNMVVVATSSDYNEENGMAHQKVPMVIEDVVPLFE
ncbi:serine hydrolase domain-containing protein [Prolixibacter bellariivorans]|nr:serine hydrolase [Prolixibacter bellariivorans]